MPGLQDVNSDLQLTNPQLNVELDREQIAALGLTVDQVRAALSSAYGSRQVSQIYAPDDEYQVIMQVAPEYQQDPAALSMLYVQAPGGKLVPLSAVVTTRQTRRPAVGQPHRPAAVGDAVVQPRARASRSATRVARVEQMARADAAGDRRRDSFQGTAQAFQDSMRGLGWVLLLAIFVIYVVLGILYESFIHPLTILSGLPSAGFGALLTLLVFKQDLNIYAFVGVIMLVGLVKKNGIMMIDFAIEARRERDDERRRRDLRGLPRPLPADHDDDDGGADGHAADRARAGAPAPRRAGRSAWRSSAACSSRRR